MKNRLKVSKIDRAVNVDFNSHDISSDLVLAFAGRPMFQLSFMADEGALEVLLQNFSDRICRLHRYRQESGISINEAVLQFGARSFVYLRHSSNPFLRIYADTAKGVEKLDARIRAVIPRRSKKPDEPYFYMLRQDGGEMSAEKVMNTSSALDDESMQLAYGADSIQWISDFSQQTRAKLGGITILDGPPGTGKSTLISQLMRRLYRSHVFYVLSVEQHQMLSNSGMVEFWQEQNERRPGEVKIVIMEDAEKILLQRRSDNNEAVSALLNIADGLMGQMLRLHVLCTLNQGMEYLDPAILRPGRLRGYRYVGFLSRDGAQKLAAKHKCRFEADENRDQYTLAEVFHGQVYQRQPARVVGFGIPPYLSSRR